MSTQFRWPQFTVDAKTRTERSPDHLKNGQYPDAQYYLNEVQQYMFRNEQLRHLRPAQFFRYFYHYTDGSTSKSKKVPTDENTLNEADEGAIEDDACHRNYDLVSSRVGVGELVKCATGLRVQVPRAKRRHNRDFCVVRSSFLEPCGKDRDAFYEQRLLLGLPWHCRKKPLTGPQNQGNDARCVLGQLLQTRRNDCVNSA